MGFDPAKASIPLTLYGFRQTRGRTLNQSQPATTNHQLTINYQQLTTFAQL